MVVIGGEAEEIDRPLLAKRAWSWISTETSEGDLGREAGYHW